MTTTTTTIREGGVRLSWGAVFAGAVVTLGLWLLLHLLGMAAGLTAIDPQDQGSLRGIGIGTGIWTVIAPLLALFAGGYVAARTTGLIDRTTGALEGAVVWGLTVLLGATLLTAVVSSTMRAGLSAAEGGFAALGAAAPGGLEALGLRSDELLVPVNQRLRQQGMPAVTPDKLESATRDTVRRAVVEGQLNRGTLVNTLVRDLGMNQTEADQAVTRIEQQYNEKKQQLRQTALVTADKAGKAMWAMFFALLLGLGAAVGGAIVGRVRRAAVVIEERPAPSPRQIPVETHS
jgi:hypothetical protein